MQEIVAFCDHHYERDGERVFGSGLKIGLAGQWRRIDLCQDCIVELLGPLETVLHGHGRAVAEVAPHLLRPNQGPAGPRSRATYSDEAWERRLESMNADRQCLWCPRIIEGGYKALKQHLYGVHQFANFEEAYGHTCPICRQGDIERLSGHIGRGHLVKLPDAFEWAYYSGDPLARAVADERRALGVGVGAPAQTDDTLDKVDAARKTWVATHGES